MVDMRDKAGLSTAQIVEKVGKTSVSHYYTKSQWTFPTEENYKKIVEICNATDDIQDIKKKYDKAMKEYEKIKAAYYETRAYFDNVHDNMNNVWHFERTSQEEREDAGGHYTPKPIVLCSRAIKSSCPEGGVVFDSFLGSGSTLIAAEKTNRVCYGIELQEKYVQTIIRRFHKYTEGTKEIKCLNRDVDLSVIL